MPRFQSPDIRYWRTGQPHAMRNRARYERLAARHGFKPGLAGAG